MRTLPLRRPRSEAAEGLAVWIREYFAVNEHFSDLSIENRNACLEVTSDDQSRGYVFVGPLQLNRDYEGRMIAERTAYQERGKEILKSFTDFEEQLAGFSWRAA